MEVECHLWIQIAMLEEKLHNPPFPDEWRLGCYRVQIFTFWMWYVWNSYTDWCNNILYSEKHLKTFENSFHVKQKTHCVPININNQLFLIKWWRSWNHELNGLIENADIVRFIKRRRIAWLGHVMRVYDRRISKKILEWKPTGTRIRGRPRKRWIVDIEEDMQIIGIKGWRKQCKERAEWKRITVKAKTHRRL